MFLQYLQKSKSLNFDELQLTRSKTDLRLLAPEQIPELGEKMFLLV